MKIGFLTACLPKVGLEDLVLSVEHEDPIWEGGEEKVKHGLALGLKHLSQFLL